MDSAVVTYRVSQKARYKGEEIHILAWDSTVWLHDAESWKCILHTETPVGNM